MDRPTVLHRQRIATVRLLVFVTEGHTESRTVPAGAIESTAPYARAGFCLVCLVGRDAPLVVVTEESALWERLGWAEP